MYRKLVRQVRHVKPSILVQPILTRHYQSTRSLYSSTAVEEDEDKSTFASESAKEVSLLVAINQKGEVHSHDDHLIKKVTPFIPKNVNWKQNVTRTIESIGSSSIDRIIFVGVETNELKGKKESILHEQFNDDIIITPSIPKAIAHGVQTFKSLVSESNRPAHELLFDSMQSFDRVSSEIVSNLYRFEKYTDKHTTDHHSFDHIDPKISVKPFDKNAETSFEHSRISGDAQNLARYLMDAPANVMTPDRFCTYIKDYCEQHVPEWSDRLGIDVFGSEWADKERFAGLKTVSKGSSASPRILKMRYQGKNKSVNDPDVILVGKGITFDSGGLSLKPAKGMKDMKGDMGGAATVISTLFGIAKHGDLDINITAYAVLCENMPSGNAVKPGDVMVARNGVSVEVDNTDAEGRLILSDMLHYASEQKPSILIDVATLTGACVVALGDSATGMYSSTNGLALALEQAGYRTGDYMWRMPLFIDHFQPKMSSPVATLNNITNSPGGGSISAATFLSNFVDFDQVDHWGHLDIASVMQKGPNMTGRPTRALYEFLLQLDRDRSLF
mmetsp:Transcript_9232/g.13682  ORF Transcript_9232/g.13682 Transcript_9232/m.13682 type:complete len:558 (+) Transcript_9232:2-1675(+)